MNLLSANEFYIWIGVAALLWFLYAVFRPTPVSTEAVPIDDDSEEGPALEALRRLTLADARAEADKALADPDRWSCSPPEPVVRTVRFGPVLEEFFARFSKVDSRRQEALIEDGEEVPSCVDDRMLLIGALSEHSEVAAREGSDEVYVMYTDDIPVARFTFPSIYHLICGIERGDIC